MPALARGEGESQARLEAKGWMGTSGLPAPTGSPHEVGSEVPACWQQQPQARALSLPVSETPNQGEGRAQHTGHSPTSGLRPPPSALRALRGGCSLVHESTTAALHREVPAPMHSCLPTPLPQLQPSPASEPQEPLPDCPDSHLPPLPASASPLPQTHSPCFAVTL